MQHRTFRHSPLSFIPVNTGISSNYWWGISNPKQKHLHFPDIASLSHVKRTKKDRINKKRHMVLPMKGDDLVSRLYYQNRLKLRYVQYFHDQLCYLSTILKKMLPITSLVRMEQRVQLLNKQITFLRLEADKIEADIVSNHLLLKDGQVDVSELKLRLVEKEEAGISFNFTIFLSRLTNTKKDLIQLFKKVQLFKKANLYI